LMLRWQFDAGCDVI